MSSSIDKELKDALVPFQLLCEGDPFAEYDMEKLVLLSEKSIEMKKWLLEALLRDKQQVHELLRGHVLEWQEKDKQKTLKLGSFLPGFGKGKGPQELSMLSTLDVAEDIKRLQAKFSKILDDEAQEGGAGPSKARSLPELKGIAAMQAEMEARMLKDENGGESPSLTSVGYVSAEEGNAGCTELLLSDQNITHRREGSAASLADWENLSADLTEMDHNRSSKFPGRRVGPAEVSTALERMNAADKWGVDIAPKGRRAPWGSPTLLPSDDNATSELKKLSLDEPDQDTLSRTATAPKTISHQKGTFPLILHQLKPQKPIIHQALSSDKPTILQATSSDKPVVHQATSSDKSTLHQATSSSKSTIHQATSTSKPIVHQATSSNKPTVDQSTSSNKTAIDQSTTEKIAKMVQYVMENPEASEKTVRTVQIGKTIFLSSKPNEHMEDLIVSRSSTLKHFILNKSSTSISSAAACAFRW